MDKNIPAGALVRVVGLVRAAELNGLTGNIVYLLPDKQRYEVDLGSPHGVKRIRPTNLVLQALVGSDAEASFKATTGDDRDAGGNVGDVLKPPFSSKNETASGRWCGYGACGKLGAALKCAG